MSEPENSQKNKNPVAEKDNPQSSIHSPQSENPQSAIRNPQSVARSAGIVSVAVMGSRLLGLVREQVFSSFFGAGFANVAFQIAFRIPNLLRDLFAEGALSAAFVSTFSHTLTKNGEREAFRLANLVNNGLIIALSIIVIAGIIFSPEIVAVLIRDVPIEPARAQLMTELAVKMTRILFPFLLMVSLAAVAMGVLNTKGRFGVPASASTMFNVGSIIGGLACAYLLAPEYITNTATSLLYRQRPVRDDLGAANAIIGMAIGTLIGGMLQWLIQVPSLRAVGYRWRPIVSFRDSGVRQVMRMMTPAIIGSAALQVNVVVNTVFATSVAEGAVVWLGNAFRLIYLPIGIFGVAISTATLPVTSRAAALENLDEFRRTLSSSLRLTLLLTIPSAVGLIVLSRPIIAMIYQYGRFTAFDTDQTAKALAYYAIGLTAYSTVRVLAPSFYALRETRIPMLASLVSIVTNYAVAKITVDYLQMGHIGLAISISAVSIINFAILFFFMRRKLGGVEGRGLFGVFAKVTLASAVMGAVCWLVSNRIEYFLGPDGLFARLINVGVSIAVGVVVFYLGARLLNVGELTQLTSAIERKFGARLRADRRA
ncbi:MAG TPA: murein biosynthesis integral membrane protein MurJ [Blastocatellia bacterium]|nr:murein biosynthesis integral membrane protein MurJ [Blastocatellia bacterium]